MYMLGNFLTKFSIRTMDEIQRHIIEWGRRGAISRRYHAKDDKDAIATWGLDLNRILHDFHVCSVIPVWRSLTFRFQTELWTNTHPTGSDTHQNAANKHTIVSDVHPDISNTRTVVSAIHHTKLKSREGAGGQNQVVSTTRTLPVIG